MDIQLKNRKLSKPELIMAIEDLATKPTRSNMQLANLLLIEGSKDLLEKKGSRVEPIRGKGKLMPRGHCFRNAASKIADGFGYVEGVVTDRLTNEQFAHGWNINRSGQHVDHTIDPVRWIYHGIVLDWQIVKRIMEMGAYCCLPYLNLK